jgi:hypothetical protein
MRTKIGVAIVIACLAAASEASAQSCELEKLHASSQGEGASADFSSVDTSTCTLGIETTVHVAGSQGAVTLADLCGRGGNQLKTVTTEQSSVVAVLVDVYDRCLATQVLSVIGTGEVGELHVNDNFKTASLRAAFDGIDEFDQPVSIAIDLVWAGVGQKERTVDHVNTSNGGLGKFVYTASGTIRDAVAVGSVVVGGTDRTPLPSTGGTMDKDAAHNFTVYR